MSETNPWEAMQRLVDDDLERGDTFIRSVTTTSAAIRGLGVTLWAAAMSAAAASRYGGWALVGAITTAAFALVDAYHSSVTNVAAIHVRTLEQITQAQHDSLARGEDEPEFVLEYHSKLLAHRFALYTFFPRITKRDLRRSTPVPIFRALYPALIGVAVIMAVILFLSAPGGPSLLPVSTTPSSDSKVTTSNREEPTWRQLPKRDPSAPFRPNP
jgi:hypothetical protein